jgi:hypothetical protein
MMEIYNTPLPLYFKNHVPVQNWDAIRNKCDDLLAIMPDQHGLESGNAKSSYDVRDVNGNLINPLGIDCFNYIRPHIWEAVKFAAEHWLMEYDKYDITQCWTNRHLPGGKTLFHKHGASTQIVIAYYLNVPENSGNLLIVDPLEYHWSGYHSVRNDINNQNGWVVPVKTGDMVIMPNFLIHGTEENTSNDNRYVLTVNIQGSFKKEII